MVWKILYLFVNWIRNPSSDSACETKLNSLSLSKTKKTFSLSLSLSLSSIGDLWFLSLELRFLIPSQFLSLHKTLALSSLSLSVKLFFRTSEKRATFLTFFFDKISIFIFYFFILRFTRIILYLNLFILCFNFLVVYSSLLVKYTWQQEFADSSESTRLDRRDRWTGQYC